MNVTLERSKFEQLCDPLNQRMIAPFKACLNDASYTAGNIGNLVLVGGMTRMPKVIDISRELAGKEPHKGVNPDEVVAVGAAIQGAVLSGDARDVLLLDVTPLTLSIETAGGIATAMIERNTTIPTKKSQVFSTFSDSQPSVDIRILQGERTKADDNKLLGNFRLDGIPPAPRGVPQIEVTFDIDANGILHVTAKDLGTGRDQKISITGSSGLNKDEIEKMRRDAESHAEEDKKFRESAETRNQLDSLIYQNEKLMKEHGDKVPEDKKGALDSLIADAKKALESNDTDKMKAAIEKITSDPTVQEVVSAMYAQQQEAGEGAGAAQAGAAQSASDGEGSASDSNVEDDSVVDADFEVVDDEKEK